MLNKVIDLCENNLDQLIEQVTARVVEKIPAYQTVDRTVLGGNVARLLQRLMPALRDEQKTALFTDLMSITGERVGEGMQVTDFLNALFTTFPVFRDFVRTAGEDDDPDLADGFAQLEERLHDLGTTAAGFYTAMVEQRLKAKNLELNRLTQRLDREKHKLSREVDETSRALTAATELSDRVIESLSAGVAVVEIDPQRITLYSSRLEEIFGIPTEQVIGRTLQEALVGVEGMDLEELIYAVGSQGRLPLRRVQATFPNGKRRTLLVRAERLFDPEGIAESTVIVIDDVSERELLIDSFSRYVSREVLDRLLARGEVPGLAGERKTCTILFADIRGFTSLAEKLSPEEVHELVNSYFEVMVEGIESNKGFIDKFVGDKVMAIFHVGEAKIAALNAVRAAQTIQARIVVLASERREAGLPPVEVGIGINSGEVLLGNVGSATRMEFTAIGDTVNVADRLQGLAKGGVILCGPTTAELIAGEVEAMAEDAIQLKGRSAAVQPWRVG